jgi:hypothetical protein
MLVISLIPKPQVTSDREVFENLINAQALTDFLLAQLTGFTDTSNGSGFNINSSKKLYTVECSETLAIKSRTFSEYDFNKDVWYRVDGVQSKVDGANFDTNLYFDNQVMDILNYDRYGTQLDDNTTETFKEKLNPSELLNAIVYGINQSEDFASKYGFENIPTNITFKDCTKSVTVKSLAFGASFVLSPSNTYKVTDVKNDNNILAMTYSGILLPVTDGQGQIISSKAEYTMDYYSSSLLQQSYAREIVNQLSFSQYGDFLEDLSQITMGSEFQSVVDAYVQDYQNTLTYSKLFGECDSEKISKLAESITEGCTSDLQKAEALENYFISNGFEYDASFKRKDGEGIEEFLFNYKKGACYEYSTSMILMARALGLPARYEEGFLVDNSEGVKTQIDLTSSSSHAFPEVYISGFGWCYFEPTQSYTLTQSTERKEFSQNTILIITSTTLCLLALLGYLFMWLVYPKLYEAHFRKKVLKVAPNDGLNLIVVRIRKLCKLSDSQTLEETRVSVFELYHVDIQHLVDVANVTFYSDVPLDSNTIKTLLDEYILLYNTIIEVNEGNRKQARKSKCKKAV